MLPVWTNMAAWALRMIGDGKLFLESKCLEMMLLLACKDHRVIIEYLISKYQILYNHNLT